MKGPIFEKKMLLYRLMKLYERYFSLLRRIVKGKYMSLTNLVTAKTELTYQLLF